MLSKDCFEKGIVLLEVNWDKKYSQEQKQTMYFIFSKELNDNDFINGIYQTLKKSDSRRLPVLGEINKYIEEVVKLKKDERLFKITEYIRLATSYTNVKYIFDDPLAHIIVYKLGGLYRLGSMKVEAFEDILKWEVPKLFKLYENTKSEYIPIFLGNPESNTIRYLGEKTKIDKWTTAYKEKQKLLNNTNDSIKLIEGDKF